MNALIKNKKDNIKKFPYLLSFISISLIILSLTVFSIMTYQSISYFKNNLTENRIIELNSEIIHLDEMASLLVRVAALTGDIRWTNEYTAIDTKLDDDIIVLLQLLPPNDPRVAILKQIQTTNEITDEIEHKTLDLLYQKKLVAAKEMILNPQYDIQENQINRNIKLLFHLLTKNASQQVVDSLKRAIIISCIILITLSVSLISWVLTFRQIKQWKLALDEAVISRLRYEDELEQSNKRLEQRVQERTAELSETIYELKRMQLGLIQSEKMATIGQLSAGIAHEINNPLSFIISNMNTLNKRISLVVELSILYQTLIDKIKAEQPWNDLYAQVMTMYHDKKIPTILSDFNNIINESLNGLDRIKKIVANLASFSHLEDTSLELIDINQCIELALNMTWNQLKYKCEIKKELSALPKIMASQEQIKMVIMTILLNAVQAISEKGIIYIRSCVNQNKIEVSIADNGCGIPEDNIRKIFNPFFTTKLSDKSTGLGLSTAYSIIKTYNGDILVESEVNKGSTFTIQLPITHFT
jgi:signal transduction histidine kinase